MSPTAVFAAQIFWFTIAWATLAGLVVWPWSRRLPPHQAVSVWVAPQMFRVMGWVCWFRSSPPECPRSSPTRPLRGMR